MSKPKYDVIYADPPWTFRSKVTNGKATKEGLALGKGWQVAISDLYNVMSDKALLDYFATHVKRMANDDAVLLMWTTDAHLPLAIKVGESAGFTYKTIGFVWRKKTVTGKDYKVMSQWTMKSTEICLLFTKGRAHSKLLKARDVRQFVEEVRVGHSVKPQVVVDSINKMFPDARKIELFARRRQVGWDAIGDELQ